MRGGFSPGDARKPRDLAREQGVSLAVTREALVRLVGEGLADRLPNRGSAVPSFSDHRRQEIAEARRSIEPVVLRLSIERGDSDWESRVRAAHRRLARTPAYLPEEGEHCAGAWAEAHRAFHRTLLEGCGNPALLEAFDRLWTLSEPAGAPQPRPGRSEGAPQTGRDGAGPRRRHRGRGPDPAPHLDRGCSHRRCGPVRSGSPGHIRGVTHRRTGGVTPRGPDGRRPQAARRALRRWAAMISA